MGKNRVVLDTNVLISAFGWRGNPHAIMEEVISGDLELAISPDQIRELRRALDYPKFDFSGEQKERFLTLLLEIGILVEPAERITALKEDPDDNIILECAVAGNAGFVVTGDKRFLDIREFRGIRIVTPREFVGLFLT